MEKKIRVLVADDESAVREVLRDLILALGNEYVVYTAADSFEALHILQSLPLELALIDICMPGLNGLELLKEAQEKYPRVVIVIITGQPSYNLVLEALRSGAADFLSKPISLAELRRVLSSLRENKPETDGQFVEASPEISARPGSRRDQNKGTMTSGHFFTSLGEKLGAIRSADELYPFLTEMALSIMGGVHSAFFLYDQEGGRLQLASQSGRNYESAPALPTSRELPREDCFKLPLKLRGDLLGVLHVYGRQGQRFAAEDLSRLQFLTDRVLLTMENLFLHESIFSNLYDSLRALINSLEARDAYSRHHSVRVTQVATLFGEKLALATDLLDSLRWAGPLHDIGKIGIPDGILLKPDKLSVEEMEIIRQHPIIGADIVAPLNLLPREKAIILHHHERWDGKGYPDGFKGEDIPFLSRLIALADAYDAITSDRPYRKRRTHEEALIEIAAQAGSQFDPDLAGKFVELLSGPWLAGELSGSAAKIQIRVSSLSHRHLLLRQESLNHISLPLKGLKQTAAAFLHPGTARSDI